jgi:hypothetical protein
MDRLRFRAAALFIVCTLVTVLSGCGATGSTSPPPPPSVSVTISPPNVSVLLGQAQLFTASVAGTTDTSVSWSVNGVVGGNPTIGTISAAGMYAAPRMLPSPSSVTVSATSVAAPTASGSSAVSLHSDIVINISPTSASLPTGSSQAFSASMTSASDPNPGVTWSVNGVAGGNSTLGTIASTGIDSATYVAPASVPSPPTLNVTATSVADPSKSSSARVTILCAAANSVSPATASVALSQSQSFTASLCVSAGTQIAWDVSGVVGGNLVVGTVSNNGGNTTLYTAPAIPPAMNQVTVRASAPSNPPQSAMATVTIFSNIAVNVSPNSAIALTGQRLTFTATVSNSSNQAVSWTANGIPNGNASVGQICLPNSNPCTPPSGPVAGSVDYVAPSSVPSPNPVALVATSQADPSKSAAALVTIAGAVAVVVSPASASVAVNQRAAFMATVFNSSNRAVSWAVNGLPNGSAAVGQICLPNSNPCTPPSGPLTGSVDYLAPSSIPPQNSVTLVATSQADPTKTGSAQVLIAPAQQVSVAVSPLYSFLASAGQLHSTQQFTARISGTTNQGVTWSVASAVAGQGCAGNNCGTIDTGGLYSAPAAAPSPNAIRVTASSQADPTKSASATVALTSGPVIQAMFPSSVTAGALSGFPLALEGQNFVAGTSGGASTILLGGNARATVCPSTTRCTTVLQPSDVAASGSLAVQVQNPGSPPPLSNPVSLVVAPLIFSQDVISLSATQPVAAGEDVVVVEPTTAAGLSQVSVDFGGPVMGSGGSADCTFEGSPIPVARPATGSAMASICIHGNFLDPSFLYEFSGPGDISVAASSLAGLFPNLIRLDLTIPSSAFPGVRTLFITTPNNDRAASSGLIEVK